jgi:hypothetical protein
MFGVSLAGARSLDDFEGEGWFLRCTTSLFFHSPYCICCGNRKLSCHHAGRHGFFLELHF